jgi:hypothetical protein
MSNRRESIQEETVRRFSLVPKLVHYTSKFAIDEDDRQSTLQTPSRRRPSSKVAIDEDDRQSTLQTPSRTRPSSKFAIDEEDGRQSTIQTPTRQPPSIRYDRRRSTMDTSVRFVLFISYATEGCF